MSKIIKCVFSVTAAVLLALSAGCGKAADGGSGKIKVVCTVYPFYDWTVNIAGSSAEVDLIVSGGTDMHSYQPSAEDVIKIAGCDLLIYGGGASDSWVTEAVAQNENPGRTVINLLELLGSLAAKEEHTEGMQTDGHDHDGAEYDEHIWLSLKNAAFLTQKIAAALSEKDGENARFTEDGGATWTHLDGGAPVSMNLWGFTRSFLDEAKARFPAFLDKTLAENPLKGEYFLPGVVTQLLEEGRARVKVLASEDKWHGVTYREDRPDVVAALADMTARGLYPEELWSK